MRDRSIQDDSSDLIFNAELAASALPPTSNKELSDNEREEHVWYLAYGSNMNSAVLTGRRKIIPAESIPCVADGYFLSFDYAGLPYVEPCFASVIRLSDPTKRVTREEAENIHNRTMCNAPFYWDEAHPKLPPTLHGVLHKLTKRQFLRVLETEGGAGSGSDTGYLVIEIECRQYAPIHNDSVTKLSSNRVLDNGLKTISALTLIGGKRATRPNLQPSIRYLNILREGAREHGLDPSYIKHLESLRPYGTNLPLRTRIGRYFLLPALLPAILLLFIYVLIRRHPRLKLFAAYMLYWLGQTAWFFHDNLLRFIIGSGVKDV
ncbi:uncharacterized protein VTP21DRAFT_3935 [Calcarisporiella thermophila]|uniref:uncharacterized protein n=1 Tax=Calcarisporiella thermophila TaxID=911321 RepID=UPI003742507B